MKVVKIQHNSKTSIICGMNNPIGLKAQFYELEDKRVVSPFKFGQNYKSYPQRAHGGLISAMCDEVAGRAIWAFEPDIVAVTTELNVKYRKPVPLDKDLIAVGEIITNSKRGYTAHTTICDANTKQVLAEGNVQYLKLPASKISDCDMHEELSVYIPDNIEDIDI